MSHLSLQSSAALLKSFELALNVKNTLEELLAFDGRGDESDSGSTPSMEVFLRSLHERGEHFCGRCADMVANYMDVDEVLSNQVERERHQAAVPAPVGKPHLHLTRIKGLTYTPVVQPKRTVPQESPKPLPRAESPPVPVAKLEDKYSIFADPKFNKLVELLEKGLVASAEKPEPETPKQLIVEIPQSFATAPSVPSQGKLLEESILGDRILELTKQLEDSRAEISDQLLAIKLLCQANKKIKANVAELKVELVAASKTQHQLGLAKVDFEPYLRQSQRSTNERSTR